MGEPFHGLVITSQAIRLQDELPDSPRGSKPLFASLDIVSSPKGEIQKIFGHFGASVEPLSVGRDSASDAFDEYERLAAMGGVAGGSLSFMSTTACDELPQFLSQGNGLGTEARWDPLVLVRSVGNASSGSSGNPNASSNDFLVRYGTSLPDPHDVQSRLFAGYFAGVLAQRRSYLFSPGLAQRIYNIVLPAGFLMPTAAGESHPFMVLPFVTYVMSPSHDRFRRVVTVSVLFLPVQWALGPDSALSLRTMTTAEAGDLAWTWDWSPARRRNVGDSKNGIAEWQLRGDLRGYLRGGAAVSPSDGCMTSRGFTQVLLQGVSSYSYFGRDSISDEHQQGINKAVGEIIYVDTIRAMLASKTSLVFTSPLSGSDGSTETNVDSNLRQDARQIADYLILHSDSGPEHPLTSSLHVDLPMIPEADRLDAYFVPPHSALVHSYDPGGGWNQRRLPFWMVGYVVYYIAALSSLRAAIVGINHEVDHMPRKRRSVEQMGEVMIEMEEVFDFDFIVRPNRQFFEALRDADGLTRDFDLLEKKVERARSDTMLAIEATRADLLRQITFAGVFVSVVLLGATLLPRLSTGSHSGAFWLSLVAAISSLIVISVLLWQWFRGRGKS